LLRITAYLYYFLNRVRPAKSALLYVVILLSEKIQKVKYYWLKCNIRHVSQWNLGSNSVRYLRTTCYALSILILMRMDLIVFEEDFVELVFQKRRRIPLRAHPLLVCIIIIIMQHHHLRTMHAGTQLTLASLRNEFWILQSHATVRSVLYKCISCTRERANVPVELMGDLPVALHCSCIYSYRRGLRGPIAMRTASGWENKSHKPYIALFVCLMTKALLT